MAIIVSRGGIGAKKIVETPLQKEDVLQKYILDNPDSLPLDEIKQGIRLMSVGREFVTASGRIDVLAIDREGELYVIETKLFKNPDKRTVVAQVLDYGAALWRTYSDPRQFTRALDAQYHFLQRLAAHFDISEDEVASVVDAVERNLHDGSVKYVVLMNKLDERLRDLITYLNQNSSFSIYAVEMQFYYHEGLEIVIPNLFGAEASRVKRPVIGTTKTPEPSKEDFLRALDRGFGADERQEIERLIRFSEEKNGEGRALVRFTKQFLIVQLDGRKSSKLYDLRSDGVLKIHVKEPGDSPDDTKLRQKFIEELGHSPILVSTTGAGRSHDDEAITLGLEDWSPHESSFEKAVDAVLPTL